MCKRLSLFHPGNPYEKNQHANGYHADKSIYMVKLNHNFSHFLLDQLQ